MKPVISVIVPAYNEEKYLPKCLQALTHQDFPLPYEIIVVDNNSTDKTKEIAKKFGVRVILELQKGVLFTRDKGIRSATSEIIAMTDADTRPAKNWLLEIYQEFKNNKNLIFLSGPYTVYDGPLWNKIYVKFVFSLINFLSKFKIYFHSSGCNRAFKKKSYLLVGGFDINGPPAEDEIGLLSKFKKVGKVKFCPNLSVQTSGRQAKNFFHHVFINLLYRYSFGYLYYRLFGKNIVSSFEDVR